MPYSCNVQDVMENFSIIISCKKCSSTDISITHDSSEEAFLHCNKCGVEEKI